MDDFLKFRITESGLLSKEVCKRGFSDFFSFAVHVRSVPYGRPTDPTDILSPIKENRGNCSSKHRLLAALAHECGHPEIELIVGIYKMSESNTLGVGSILAAASVTEIPETHCYLRVGGCRYDFTGLAHGPSSPFESLLSENVVLPFNLSEEKLALHQQAIITWAAQHEMSFSRAREIGEACIEALGVRS